MISLLCLMVYLNKSCGELYISFKEYLDPSLGDFLAKRNPWLRSRGINISLRTATIQKAVGKNDLLEDNYTTQQPNLLVKMIWQEFLVSLEKMLLSLGQRTDKQERQSDSGAVKLILNDFEKAKLVTIECVVELCKALFYCDEECGFSIDELEGEKYNDVRDCLITLNSFS